MSEAVVIGVGRTRHEGVGPEVLRRLGPTPGVRLLTVGEDSLALLLGCQGCSRMIVVDCVVTGSRPGTIHCWEASEGMPPSAAFRLPHRTTDIVGVLEMARALGRLPPSVRIYGIEVDAAAGEGTLTPPVQAAVDLLAACLRQELAG